MTTPELDMDKKDAFAGNMLNFLNGAGLTLMISIGHQTGLFDAMSNLPPSTTEQIAQALELNERYVREWLGSMVTGKIIEYNSAEKTYWFPPEHAAFLTRAAGPDNLAVFAQGVSLLATVEDQVIQSFRSGGGVPYSAYPRFQQLQAEETRGVFDATLVQRILPLIPGLVNRLNSGIAVADFGCGQGHAINVMAQAFPNSRFVGYDFSEEGVGVGRTEAAQLHLSNAKFEVRDLASSPQESVFDLVTAFDVIHDLAHPSTVLRNIADSLRSDGIFLMVDIAASSNLEENVEHPLGPILYAVSTTHCMTVSLAQGGEGLGTVWGEQKAMELLDEAGFTEVDVTWVEGDILNSYYISRKG